MSKAIQLTTKRHCTCGICKTNFQVATVEEIEKQYGVDVELSSVGKTPVDSFFITPKNKVVSFMFIAGTGRLFSIFGHTCVCPECNIGFTVSDKNTFYRI